MSRKPGQRICDIDMHRREAKVRHLNAFECDTLWLWNWFGSG